MAGPRGEPAYHQSQSPTQTPAAFSTGRPQPLRSPNDVPLPHQPHQPQHQQHQHAHHPGHLHPHPHPHAHQPFRSPTTPGAPDLPPITTAVYPRDRNTYYDPTQDNGPVGRDAAPLPPHYPPPVRALARPSRCPDDDNRDMQARQANSQQTRDPHAYPESRPAHSPYERSHHSPVAQYAHHSPPQRRPSQGPYAAAMDAISHSPVSPTVYQSRTHGAVQPVQPPPQPYAPRQSIKEEVSPVRAKFALCRVRFLSLISTGTTTTRRSHVALQHHVLWRRHRAREASTTRAFRLETTTIRQARGHALPSAC